LAARIPPDSSAVMIGFAALGAGLAAIGYDSIHVAQRGVAFVMIALLAVFSAGALLVGIPAAQWPPGASRAAPFLSELFAAASSHSTSSAYGSHYSRSLRREVSARASFWWA